MVLLGASCSNFLPSPHSISLYSPGLLQQLQEGREQLEELWTQRQLRLDLCLQLRIFEHEVLEVRFVILLLCNVRLMQLESSLNPV